jgi:hypothetical protein
MTVLDAAMQRVMDRAAAIGATLEGESFEPGIAPMLFSGLPVDAEVLAAGIDHRTDLALAAIGRGVHPGEVLKGALAEAVLLGFYIALEDRP